MGPFRPDQGNSLVRTLTWALVAMVGVWLVLAAALVDVEYYDGLSAICNSKFFLGLQNYYIFDRGPLMAWILAPAEAVRSFFGRDPVDFRLAHATTAAVHVVYLVFVCGALVRVFGYHWSTLAAITTAVTSYVFFSYAPFISHDLFPGALLLAMVIWSEDLAQSPRLAPWLCLVAAGTVAPLVKQTYGVFWIAVLAAHLPTLLRRDPSWRTSRRAMIWLVLGAAASGLITWILYAWVLRTWAPDVPSWVRPWRNLQYLAHIYDGTDVTFPWWIYLRNFWAYGRLTTLLLIPGLGFSLGGSRLQRRIALVWIAAIVFMHVLPLREVRYIAFLAPLSAFLIVPAARTLSQYRVTSAVMALLLLLDIFGGGLEAARIGKPFYRRNELRTLLQPLTDAGAGHVPFFYSSSMLSFVAPDQSPLAADRYHRIFHVGVLHIGLLYGLPLDQMRVLVPTQAAAVTAGAPEGTWLLFSTSILAHGPAWVPAPPVGSASFAQGIARLQSGLFHRRADGSYQGSTDELMPVAIIAKDDVRPLQRLDGERFLLPGVNATASSPGPEILPGRAFVVQRPRTESR
jgi:hypothetical protein